MKIHAIWRLKSGRVVEHAHSDEFTKRDMMARRRGSSTCDLPTETEAQEILRSRQQLSPEGMYHHDALPLKYQLSHYKIVSYHRSDAGFHSMKGSTIVLYESDTQMNKIQCSNLFQNLLRRAALLEKAITNPAEHVSRLVVTDEWRSTVKAAAERFTQKPTPEASSTLAGLTRFFQPVTNATAKLFSFKCFPCGGGIAIPPDSPSDKVAQRP